MSATGLSLFAGCGGLDLGFSFAGVRPVLANERDPVAADTLRANSSAAVDCRDVADARDLLSGGRVDFVFGGPPCQGYSVAGKMDPDDPRSALVWRFMDIVEARAARGFVMENVAALGRLSKWSEVRRALVERGERAGFETGLFVLNAKDHGVPQSRERLFAVGVKSGLTGFARAVRDRESAAPTALEVLDTFDAPGVGDNARTCGAAVNFAKAPVLRRSPFGGMLFNGSGRPFDLRGPAPTLTASMGGNKTPIVDESQRGDGRSFVSAYHARLMAGGAPLVGRAPACLRRLTVDEALALQGFPREFRLSGSRAAMFRQIGNAVPPPLARSVAEALLEAAA